MSVNKHTAADRISGHILFALPEQKPLTICGWILNMQVGDVPVNAQLAADLWHTARSQCRGFG